MSACCTTSAEKNGKPTNAVGAAIGDALRRDLLLVLMSDGSCGLLKQPSKSGFS